MATSSPNSSQNHNLNSGSESDLIGQRKRKRMQSNRESARKSRMRKQKHLDDLTDQIKQMNKHNSDIIAAINDTTPRYVKVEAENSVLKAQMNELSQRLDYLNQIINLMDNNCAATHCLFEIDNQHDFMMNNTWNFMYPNQQPIMAQMLQY